MMEHIDNAVYDKNLYSLRSWIFGTNAQKMVATTS